MRAPGWMTEYERRTFVAGLRRAQHVVTLTDAVAAALRSRGLVRPERVSEVVA